MGDLDLGLTIVLVSTLLSFQIFPQRQRQGEGRAGSVGVHRGQGLSAPLSALPDQVSPGLWPISCPALISDIQRIATRMSGRRGPVPVHPEVDDVLRRTQVWEADPQRPVRGRSPLPSLIREEALLAASPQRHSRVGLESRVLAHVTRVIRIVEPMWWYTVKKRQHRYDLNHTYFFLNVNDHWPWPFMYLCKSSPFFTHLVCQSINYNTLLILFWQ